MHARTLTIALCAALLSACSIPGIRSEGRTIGPTRGEIPAEPAAVYDSALTWLTLRYRIIESEKPQRIRAEMAITDATIDVIEVTFEAAGANRTAMSVRGWTDLMNGGTRQQAAKYSDTVEIDVNRLFEQMSCASAHWPGCP
jgi:hypothetical protein